VASYQERRFGERPRALVVRDFEVPRFAWTPLLVRLLAADFRVDLRVEAVEPVFSSLRLSTLGRRFSRSSAG